MKTNDNQTTPQIYYRPLHKWIEVTLEEKQNWERFIGTTRKSKQRAGTCCIPYIDEETYEGAVSMKAARQRNAVRNECEGIALLRNRVKCADCGSPMVRRISSKRNIKERWTCQNPECGKRLRISDGDLLQKITILMNRIIANSELLIPKPKTKPVDSPAVANMQRQIENELSREHPSEEYIVEKISGIASELYKETQAKKIIVAQIARKRVMMMNPQENFNCDYFSDLIDYVTLSSSGEVKLHTKVGTEITEGENESWW